MQTKSLLSGKRFHVLALLRDNNCQVEEYIKNLNERDRKKVLALLVHVSENGPPKNIQKSRKILGSDDILEFKPTSQIRILWFYDGPGRIVLTHAFRKKRRDIPAREIDRAEAARKSYQGNR